MLVSAGGTEYCQGQNCRARQWRLRQWRLRQWRHCLASMPIKGRGHGLRLVLSAAAFLLPALLPMAQPPSPPSLPTSTTITELQEGVPVGVSVAAGACRVYRLRVTDVHAGDGRGVVLSYSDLWPLSSDGYIAVGMPVQHDEESPASADNTPAGRGVSPSSCWHSASAVAFDGVSSGRVVEFSQRASRSSIVPHSFPTVTGEPIENCNLYEGEYYIYIKNIGANNATMQLDAAVHTEMWSQCAVPEVDSEFWVKTLLLGVGIIGACFLLVLLVFRFVCRTATRKSYFSGDSDEEYDTQYQLAQDIERKRKRRLLELEAKANALYAAGKHA